MRIDPPQVDEQIAMLRVWYRDVLNNSVEIKGEIFREEEIVTVRMPHIKLPAGITGSPTPSHS